MEIARRTQVKFVLSSEKVLVNRVTEKFRARLEHRFPSASVDVRVSLSTYILLTFNANDFPLHWTDAWMKREVQKIFSEFSDLT